jgi:chemotaxis protein CheD
MSSHVVGISEIKFASKPEMLVTYGLGSCVAIILHEPASGITAMAHVMLPMAVRQDRELNAAKYADTAVTEMMDEMDKKGVSASSLVAKMAGGADMFAGKFTGTGRRIGTRNILAARKALDAVGVRLVSQDVGGVIGRTVEFHTDSGTLVVRTLKGGRKEI